MTPRRVLTLLEYLPEGSANWAEELGGQQYRSWTTTQVIAAQARDAHYKKPFPRPDPGPQVATLDQALPI